MTAKASIDDLFEKQEQADPALLSRLAWYERRLRVILGMAIASLLLTPEFHNNARSPAPFFLTLFLLGVPLIGMYLLVWPRWRRVPVARRRVAIMLAFLSGLLAFTEMPVAAILSHAHPNVVMVLLVIVVGGGYFLYWLNRRWQEEPGELFP